MKHWIIEHRTRGCLVDYDELDSKPKFSWSVPRNHKRLMVFYTEDKARQAMQKKGMPFGCYLLEVTTTSGHSQIKEIP
jgi:hypothetical protein